MSGEQKNKKCIDRIREIFLRYAPEVVVLEDYDRLGSHRRPRVSALIRSVKTLAERGGIRNRAFSRRDVRRSFAALDRPTKHAIAMELPRRYPELAARLPEARKCWESEDERMNLYDSASLALTYFERPPRRSRPSQLEAA